MDFADSPEHAAFRAEFRHWLETNLPDDIKVDDAADQRVAPDRETLRKTHRLAKEDARRRLGRNFLAEAIWRARRRFYAAGDFRRGIFPCPRADPAGGERDQPARPDPDPMRHRGAETAAPAAHPCRRGALVPGLFRTRRRRRSGEPQDPRGRSRRPFRRQRPEGVDLGRAFRRLVLFAGPHRPRGAQASRHQLSLGRYDDAGRHRAPARPVERPPPFQRGVFRRCHGAEGEFGRRAQRGLEGRDHDPDVRAERGRRARPRRPDRPPRRTGKAISRAVRSRPGTTATSASNWPSSRST